MTYVVDDGLQRHDGAVERPVRVSAEGTSVEIVVSFSNWQYVSPGHRIVYTYFYVMFMFTSQQVFAIQCY